MHACLATSRMPSSILRLRLNHYRGNLGSTGQTAQYMHIGNHVQEVNWYKERFRSWFVGDAVIADGGLYLSTPVDPLFLALPILEASRRQVCPGNLPGMACN